ncbi:MAG: CHAT domain-containing protein [bacterium]|nr:CHAT domain-containing protein [bacterium]
MKISGKLQFFLLSLLVVGCFSENPSPTIQAFQDVLSPDFPLDLTTIPLSDELSQAMTESFNAISSKANDDPRFTNLRLRDQLVLGIQRPETRTEYGEKLYQLLHENPEEFLWLTTAIRYEGDLNRYRELEEILASPTFSDTLGVNGAFAQGLIQYGYTSRGRFYRRAAQASGLSPINELMLKRKLAMVKSREGNHLAAVRDLLQILPQVRIEAGPRLEVVYWSSISIYLKRAGRLDDALHAAALGLYLAQQSDNLLYQGLMKKKLADLLYARQEFDGALLQYNQTIAFASKHNLPWVKLKSLDSAAELSGKQGRPEVALQYDRRTLQHSLRINNTLNAPRNMMNIADDFMAMGQMDSCLVYQQRASRWIERYPNDDNEARLPFFLAEYYCHVGQFDLADSLLTLVSDQSSGAGVAQDEINILLGLINRGLEMSRPDLALRSLQRLEELRPLVFDQRPDQNVLADVEIATANLNMALGDYQPARQALQRAWTLIEQGTGIEKQWQYHRASGHLAVLRGDLKAAGTHFSSAFGLAEQWGHPNELAESRNLLARILLLENQTAEVRDLFYDQDQDPSFGGNFRARLTNLWFRGRSWRQAGDLSLARAELEKAIELSTVFSPGDVMAGVHLELGQTLTTLGQNSEARVQFEKAENLLNSTRTQTAEGSLMHYLDNTRRQLSQAFIGWHEQNKSSDSHLQSLLVANKELLRTTMPNAPAVESVQELASLSSVNSCTAVYLVEEDKTRLWVGHAGNWVVVDLPSRQDIQTVAELVMADLNQPSRQPDKRTMKKLGDMLLSPLLPYWSSGQDLNLVADGILHNLPWPALIISTDTEKFAIEHGPIVRWPGLLKIQDHHLPNLQKPGLLALGYNGSQSENDRLSNAEDEARRVARNWTWGKAHLLVASEATVSAVATAPMDELSVLHIASHARVKEGWSAESYLLLANDSNEEALTAANIRQMNWPRELVYLSSCEAGRSHRSGRGLMGLAGAFLESGVRTVISSTAKVDDRAGLYLAERFYHHWGILETGQRQNKAAALRAAQLDMIKKNQDFSHPFYWAHCLCISGG